MVELTDELTDEYRIKPSSLSTDGSVLLPLRKIVPNRLNPNEMDIGNRLLLREAMIKDDYDSIIVSPATIFYDQETLKTIELYFEDSDGVQYKLSPEEAYIICDGKHRYKEAIEAEKTEIKAIIWYITERDAMPWFYKRHKVRGELDPLKEAELFWHERHVNGLPRKEIIKRYNLSGVNYLKSRLQLSNLSTTIADLYYDPPEEAPGKLTMSHIKELCTIPRKLQKPVALISLKRNWSFRDIRAECRRIKNGKGITDPQAYVPPPEHPPPPKTDVEVRNRPSPLEKRENREPVSDEELFEEYPDEIVEEKEESPKTLAEQFRDTVHYEPTVIPVPEFWTKKPEELPSEPILDRPQPPLIITRSLMEPFIEQILILGVKEGLDLNSELPIDGKPPIKYLKDQIDEDLYLLLDRKKPEVLPRIALRAFQLWKLETKKV